MKKYNQLSFLLFFIFFLNGLSAHNIFLFGDSHQGAFKGIPNCHSALNDGITMHRVGRDKKDVVNLERVPLTNGDAVVFSFGQIDVGWHICKQRDLTGRDMDEILETLATNYIEALCSITEPYPDVIKIVYSVPPPSDIFFHETLKLTYSGSLEERVKITRTLNELLKTLCMMKNIEFLDVYESYADSRGVLLARVDDGSGYHIDPKYNRPIRNKLSQILEKYSTQNR